MRLPKHLSGRRLTTLPRLTVPAAAAPRCCCRAGTAALALFALFALAATAAAQLQTQVVVTGLLNPVAFVQDRSDHSVQFIVEQGGRIRVAIGGVLQGTDFLNLEASIAAGGESGLLGLAFPPDDASSGRFYVNFTNPQGHTVVARFRRSNADRLVAESGLSRFDLVWPDGRRFIAQPYPNHNGARCSSGPTDTCTSAWATAGAAPIQQGHAQNPGSLLGKMLRLNVNVPDAAPQGYDVPPDNPFLDGVPVAALGEIWAFGFRNPWKFSFDDPALGGTGALLIGDVGQGAREEIDHEPAGRGGRNYGWRNREGTTDHVTTDPPAFGPLIEPVFDYGRSEGQSITGGYVYRGPALGAAFRGRYFFADFSAGRVWSLALTVDGATGEARASALLEHTSELGGTATLGLISAFGVDAQGELYVVSWSRGMVLRLALRSDPRMHIDLPAGSTTVTQPFRLAGWALNLGATAGTGVDAVHVWAFPNPGSGASPFFVGVAAYGGLRSDVGAVFGSGFAGSGYNLTVQGLAPGRYQFVVYAHSAVTGTFNTAERVTVDVTFQRSLPRTTMICQRKAPPSHQPCESPGGLSISRQPPAPGSTSSTCGRCRCRAARRGISVKARPSRGPTSAPRSARSSRAPATR